MKFRRLRVLYALGVMKKTRCARSRAHLRARAHGAMGYLGRQRSYREPPSSGRRLSLRDADDGLGPHPSNSRHGSLLSAAGLAARENEQKLRSSSRRSPAAHTKRSMSRAARGGEDSTPGRHRRVHAARQLALPSGRGSSSSSGGWGSASAPPPRARRCSRARSSRWSARPSCFPKLYRGQVRAHRHDRQGRRAPQDQRGGRRTGSSSSSSPPSRRSKTSAGSDADAPGRVPGCVRLVAGDADVSSELLSLVHAAKRHRESGTRVVWDYADAAATCPCGELVRSGATRPETTRRGALLLSARRLLRLSASSAGACAPGRSARETNNGWTALFASDARAFTDASAEATILRAARRRVGEENGFGLKRGRRRVAGGGRAQRHVRGGAGRVGVEPGDARGSGRRDEEPGR